MIIFVNRAFEEMTGYRAREVLGETPRIPAGAGHRPADTRRVRHCLSEGRRCSGQAINYRKDGSKFWLEWRITVRDAAGRITHWISFQRALPALRP